MAPQHPSSGEPVKRAPLPKNTRITKRPLIHPAIPTPRSSSQQTIYLRTHTKFIPTVKRIRNLLSHIEKRRTQALLPKHGRGNLTAQHVEKAAMEELRRERLGDGKKENEAVHVRASGKAIENALGIANWFLEKGERVKIKTGTVGAIDDLEVDETDVHEGGMDMVEEEDEKEDEKEDEEVPEARIRHISYVDISISAR